MKTAILLLAALVLTTKPAPAADKPVAAEKKKTALKIGQKYVVVTSDGKIRSGTLAKQDKKSITIKVGKNAVKIPRADIEAIRPAPSKAVAAAAAAARRLEQAQRRLEILRLQQRLRGGEAPAVKEKVDPKDPKVRLLIISPKGPLLADLSIYVNGESFRTLRKAIVDDVIKHGDTNKDGKATWAELLQNPRVPLTRLRTISSNPRYLKTYITRYDLNGDELLDRYEVRRMIAQMGFGAAFTVTSSYSYYSQPNVKGLLDVNIDGKLSAAEIAAAADRLKSRDANDNDLVEAGELGGGIRMGRRGVRLPVQGRGAYAIDEGTSMASLYLVLQGKFANKAKEIPKSAFRVAPKLFTELDLNKNGLLDSGEMVALHLAKPQLKIDIRIGKTPGNKPSVQINGETRDKSFKATVINAGARSVSLGFPGWKLRLNVPDVTPYNRDYTRTAQSYLTRYDADKNGYIDKKDVKQLGNLGQYVERQMKQWDINADGKVYAKEIKQYYDRMQAPQRSQISMASITQGPSLFAALDISGDNRLSLREMRTAARQLKRLDTNKNGVIDPNEMPGETVLSFTRGRTAYARARYNPRRVSTPRATAGPRWFVHMDKNGDGDITLREFLGTKAQFAKLDTNKDGFIEPKEAAAAGK